jgi:hypothetical protein
MKSEECDEVRTKKAARLLFRAAPFLFNQLAQRSYFKFEVAI